LVLVQKGEGDVYAREAVHEAVVGLRDDGKPAIRKPLDDCEEKREDHRHRRPASDREVPKVAFRRGQERDDVDERVGAQVEPPRPLEDGPAVLEGEVDRPGVGRSTQEDDHLVEDEPQAIDGEENRQAVCDVRRCVALCRNAESRAAPGHRVTI
jgi:hypothetical protein